MFTVLFSDCGDPTPTNGFSNSTDTTFGSVVNVTCVDGYTLNGSSILACNSDGNWSEYPSCIIRGNSKIRFLYGGLMHSSIFVQNSFL